MKGFIAIIGWVLFWGVLIFFFTSCGSTFYGPTGLPTARIFGDYTYTRSATGSVTITLKHSPVIAATGKAAALGITATGTAASAAILAK